MNLGALEPIAAALLAVGEEHDGILNKQRCAEIVAAALRISIDDARDLLHGMVESAWDSSEATGGVDPVLIVAAMALAAGERVGYARALDAQVRS